MIGKTVNRNGEEIWDIYQKDYLNRGEVRRTKAKSIWEESEINYQNGTVEIKTLLGMLDYTLYTSWCVWWCNSKFCWGFQRNRIYES